MKITSLYALLGAFSLILAVFSFSMGPDGFSLPFLFNTDGLQIAQLRLNRLILSLVAGSSLAASGCSLQALFRNPLADPHSFGISGGAALGACLVIAFMPISSALPSMGAIVGGFIAFVILFFLVIKWNVLDLGQAVLVGVLLNALAAGCITMLKTGLAANKIQSLLFWLIGSIQPIPTSYFFIIIPLWITGLFMLFSLRGELEAMSFGITESRLLGVHPEKVIQKIVFANAILIGNVVSYAGMIGFVGLVIPHFVRLYFHADLRLLLPLSTIFGGICMIFFDGLSRSSFFLFGSELPIGALASVVLSPFFFLLLFKGGHARNTSYS